MVTPAATIRRAVPGDARSVRKIFCRAVLAVDVQYYTPEELADWAACGDECSRWYEKIEHQAFFIAQKTESQVIGFGSITSAGYLDLLYVDPQTQRQGVGVELLKVIEEQAKIDGCQHITSEVSLPALSFFLHRGYRVEREQKRCAQRLVLTNFSVRKTL